MNGRDIFAEQRLIGIVRTSDAGTAYAAASAMTTAGLRAVEITLTIPGAVELIRRLVGESPGAVVGVGTVLSAAEAEAAIAAGARFVVSPGLIPDVVRAARDRDVPAIPGTGTVTEMLHAEDLGASYVKLFPAGSLSPDWLRNVLAALPDLAVIPTGGVALDDAPAWLAAGAAAVGLGSALSAGEVAEVTERVRKLLAKTQMVDR